MGDIATDYLDIVDINRLEIKWRRLQYCINVSIQYNLFQEMPSFLKYAPNSRLVLPPTSEEQIKDAYNGT